MCSVDCHLFLQGCSGRHCCSSRHFNCPSAKSWCQGYGETRYDTFHEPTYPKHGAAVKEATQKQSQLPKHFCFGASDENCVRAVLRVKEDAQEKENTRHLDRERSSSCEVFIRSKRESFSHSMQARSSVIVRFISFILLCSIFANSCTFYASS